MEMKVALTISIQRSLSRGDILQLACPLRETKIFGLRLISYLIFGTCYYSKFLLIMPFFLLTPSSFLCNRFSVASAT